jgi:hypothetical protein
MGKPSLALKSIESCKIRIIYKRNFRKQDEKIHPISLNTSYIGSNLFQFVIFLRFCFLISPIFVLHASINIFLLYHV